MFLMGLAMARARFFIRIIVIITLAPLCGNPLSIFMQQTIHGMINFNKYLFGTADTYKILLESAPFYMAGRAADAPTHAYFYNKKKHRNIHEIAPVFKYSVDPLMGISFTALILLQFFSSDERTRLTSNTFLAALPFLWLYKDALKLIPIKGSLRPKNEYFSPCKKYYGGFPSGHMFEVAFMAFLFGAELGKDYAIPLSAFALLVAIQSVAINRHTVSQVVAGAALGCVFGAASEKVVKNGLHHERTYDILVNKSGALALSYEKRF